MLKTKLPTQTRILINVIMAGVSWQGCLCRVDESSEFWTRWTDGTRNADRKALPQLAVVLAQQIMSRNTGNYQHVSLAMVRVTFERIVYGRTTRIATRTYTIDRRFKPLAEFWANGRDTRKVLKVSL